MSKVSTIRKAAGIANTQHVREGVQLFRNRKTLWCMLKEVWRGQYRMSVLTSVVTVLGLLYVVIPLDFDWIPFVGWIDDGLVIYLVIKRLQKETQRFNRRKAMARKRTC